MPTTTPFVILCALLAFAVFDAPAEAQFLQTEIQLRAPEGEVLQVRQITGRSFGVERTADATVFTSTVSHRDVCQTPCRFVLDKPMELAIQHSTFVVPSEGGIVRYQIRPSRPGLRVLSGFAAAVSGIAIGFGGSVLYYRSENEIQMPGIVSGAKWALALGIPLLITAVVGLVRSRSRVTRVDRFEF